MATDTTAVLPPRFNLNTLKHGDPRFYVGKDLVVELPRRDDTAVPPENALIVPLARMWYIVTLQKSGPPQVIYRLEETKHSPHVPGRI